MTKMCETCSLRSDCGEIAAIVSKTYVNYELQAKPTEDPDDLSSSLGISEPLVPDVLPARAGAFANLVDDEGGMSAILKLPSSIADDYVFQGILTKIEACPNQNREPKKPRAWHNIPILGSLVSVVPDTSCPPLERLRVDMTDPVDAALSAVIAPALKFEAQMRILPESPES